MPHYDKGTFLSPKWLLKKYPTVPSCICIDENAGFVVIDDKATVISADGDSKCYVISRKSATTAVPIDIDEVRSLVDLEIIMPSHNSGKL